MEVAMRLVTSSASADPVFIVNLSVAANESSGEGYRKLAECAYEGWKGVCKKNISKAHRLYELGFNNSDGQSAWTLGYMHQNGYGCEKNATKALFYYNASSELDIYGGLAASVSIFIMDVKSRFMMFFAASLLFFSLFKCCANDLDIAE